MVMAATYNLKVDYEAADLLFKRILQDDYEGVCGRINEIRSLEALDSSDKEDLNFYVPVKEAMETLMGYYFADWEKKRIIRD